MLPLLLATYGTVFVAEIVGDKLLYTTGVLAARYRTAPIMAGMSVAFMLKMGVAVLIGESIRKLPPVLVASVTAASFIGVAIAVWRKPDYPERARQKERASRAAMISFATIFFSEWGDVGQVTAAAMSASALANQSAAAIGSRMTIGLAVWVAAVAAMVTKGVLAAFLGGGIRQWIRSRVSPQAVRYVAVSAHIVLGSLSVLEAVGLVD